MKRTATRATSRIPAPDQKDTLWIIGIALLATLVRVLYAVQTSTDPFRGLLFLDSKVYHLLANEIATKSFWGSEVFFRAPLFPYLLGLTYKLFGQDQTAIKIVNAALGVGSALLGYLTAKIHFDLRVARISGIIIAIYPTLYFFEQSLMPTALEVFCFTATIYFLSRYEKSQSATDLALGGFSLGCAALARPTILSLLLVLPIWLYFLDNRKWSQGVLKRMALVVVPMALIILPVTVRNYIIEHDLVLISSQGGSNFYIGNNTHSDGQTVEFPFGETPLNKYEDHIWSASTFLAERSTRHSMTAGEVSSYWFQQGRDFVFERPGEAVELLLKKTYLLFCGEELFNNANPLSSREYSLLYAMSLWDFGLRFPYGLLAPIFLIGTIMLLREKQRRILLLLFVHSQVITLALFFVSSRFRQPLLPIMIIVAVYTGVRLYDWIRSGSWKSTAGYVAALVLLVVALNPPFEVASAKNRSMYHALMGGALASQEKYPEAVEQLRQAIIIEEDNATAFQLLGSLYVKSGQLDQALAVLHRAEELAPDAVQNSAMLARVYYDRADFPRALKYFEHVIETGATIERFNFWAARSAFETGDFEKARKYLDAATRENPKDAEIPILRAKLDSRGGAP